MPSEPACCSRITICSISFHMVSCLSGSPRMFPPRLFFIKLKRALVALNGAIQSSKRLVARAGIDSLLLMWPLVPIGSLTATLAPVQLTKPWPPGGRAGAFGSRPLISDWTQPNYKSWPLYLPLTKGFSQLQSSCPLRSIPLTSPTSLPRFFDCPVPTFSLFLPLLFHQTILPHSFPSLALGHRV